MAGHESPRTVAVRRFCSKDMERIFDSAIHKLLEMLELKVAALVRWSYRERFFRTIAPLLGLI